MGTQTAARQPSSVAAHWMPRLLNICRAKSGKPAAAMERRKVLAAMADAALGMVLEMEKRKRGKIRTT